ncbi:MAG TPA: PilN domain-containing protein [Acetobacteraceae bacterium]|jgi:general secretion pathway protein L|nr:PilN domain-containing protein [Acetobacteraceae bacterium]
MAVGTAVLREVLRWWARQMRALLPQALLPDASQSDALLVAMAGMSDAPQIRLSLRRRRRETPLGSFRLDEAGRRAAMAAIRQRSGRVILRPDPAAVLERKVMLPLAAEHDVTQVLRYEMDRLTPFAAEQVFWSAIVERRDRAAGRLEIRLSLLPKSLVQPALATIAAIGLKVSAIETASHSGAPRLIDLVPPSSQRRRTLAFAWAACGVLAVIALATPFVTQSLARRTVEARIADLQPRIAQAEALRRRLAAGSAGNDVIATEHAGIGDALQVLATVTELLPDDTVLADLSLRQSKLSISGRSRAAPVLIPAMAGDPALHNPSFAAPVTRTPDGNADTFVIRAELGP